MEKVIMKPITETPNVLTTKLGESSPSDVVRLLRQTDSQMFSGWGGFPGFFDDEICLMMNKIAHIAHEILLLNTQVKDSMALNGVIVLSGCGTSGRVAFLVARAFNLLLDAVGLAPCFRYLIAGGDAALFTSREAPEDSVAAGIEDIAVATANVPRVLYVGITCGLSAPYVAAQLHHLITKNPESATIVLLGFNPVARARNVHIEGWDKTFADVVQMMLDTPKHCHVLVPVVGPEALTGSTRMKGGSATKIILETIFSAALGTLMRQTAEQHNRDTSEPKRRRLETSTLKVTPISSDVIRCGLREYEQAVRDTYAEPGKLARMVEFVGGALRRGGRMYYLGAGSYGIAALVDASECPPTFNATWDEIRAYLHGGYETLRNKEGNLAEAEGSTYFHLKWSDFEKDILPSLTSADVVIFIVGSAHNIPDSVASGMIALSSKVSSRGAQNAVVSVGRAISASAMGVPDISATCEAHVVTANMVPSILSPWTNPHDAVRHGGTANDTAVVDHMGFLGEISVKLVLNAMTTGGHVLKGKILQNRMVDLQVSNNKLYYRTLGIITAFTGRSETDARTALLRTLYEINGDVPEAVLSREIGSHVKASADAIARGIRVVPTALLLCVKPDLKVPEAVGMLREEPCIGDVLNQLSAKKV
eukprot:m.432496 g.432496  ORF g.432496 m.432496 type:complete len:650 (+) comp21408_c0_seq3:177-2126(+)